MVQWKHWSQIRSTIYNISIKIGKSGCGNKQNKGGTTPVLHSQKVVSLQCRVYR